MLKQQSESLDALNRILANMPGGITHAEPNPPINGSSGPISDYDTGVALPQHVPQRNSFLRPAPMQPKQSEQKSQLQATLCFLIPEPWFSGKQ